MATLITKHAESGFVINEQHVDRLSDSEYQIVSLHSAQIENKEDVAIYSFEIENGEYRPRSVLMWEKGACVHGQYYDSKGNFSFEHFN